MFFFTFAFISNLTTNARQIEGFFIRKPNKFKKRHLNQQSLLSEFLYGVIKKKQVVLKEIAFERSGTVQLESKIKQQSRFLNQDARIFYKSHCCKPLQNYLKKSLESKQIDLIVDSSVLATNCIGIMISFIYKDTAIPLVWSVYQGTKGHLLAKYNIELVEQAIDLLKPFSFQRITLFGDGEYSSAEFMKFLNEKQWHFVFRIAINDTLSLGGQSKIKLKELPVDVYCERIKFNAIEEHFFNVIKVHNTKHKEPICLISNTLDGFEMSYEYPKRFSIERLFKNLKSNGFHIHQSKIKAKDKVCNLLSIVVLAFLFVLLFKELTLDNIQNPLVFRKDRNDLSLFVACYQYILFHFFNHNGLIINKLQNCF